MPPDPLRPLTLDDGPLRAALDQIAAAQQEIDAARNRFAQTRAGFVEVLKRELRSHLEAGKPSLADDLVQLLGLLYWEHRELRLADLAAATGYTGEQVRDLAGPREVDATCIRCDRPVTVWQQSRSQRPDATARCPDCRDREQRQERRRADPDAEALASLRRHLEARLAGNDCTHTLELTERWALREGRDPRQVMGWVQDRGGWCDCEVLMNVHDTDETWANDGRWAAW